MKKSILLLMLPLLFMTSIAAGDTGMLTEETYSDWEEKKTTEQYQFIGTTLSVKKSKFESAGTKTDATLGLRYGLQDTQWRAMVTLEKDYRGFKAATLETDVLFNTLDIETLKVKPYIGASVGYYDHKENDNKHAIFGLHSGFIINVSDSIDFDFGISHKRKRDTDNLKRLNELTLSIHYFF
jgi:opacity protein-like surface antigen